MHFSNKELRQPRYGENGIAILHSSPNNGVCFTLHWHDRIELLRVWEGELLFWRGEQGPYSVKAGEMAIVCPRQLHRGISGAQGVRYDVIMFETDRFFTMHDLAQGLLWLDPICKEAQVIEAFDRLCLPVDPIADAGNVYRLMGLMLSHCHPILLPRLAADERFAHVVRYVDEHFLDSISTRELSERFGYEQSYFCRRFKRVTGLPLLTYVEILRLEQARSLLLTTAENVSAIALQSGFTDLSYFSTRFRRHFGLSPSAMRKT